MIAANELRIGNWVEFDGKLDQVTAVGYPGNDPHDVHFDGVSLVPDSIIKPIPITPEILEKAGFEYSSFGLWKKDFHQANDWFRLEYFEDDSTYPDRGTCLLGGQRFFNHPKYVHQLQNLYFALTGEELIIQL